MTEEEEDNRKTLERVIIFSDAVYAIALTLLVLELKLPEGLGAYDAGGMFHALKEMSPKFFAFLLGALLVGGNWMSTINYLRTLVKTDMGLITHIIIFLILISLIPFCADALGSYPNNPMSYVIFGIVTGASSMNGYFFVRHNRKKKLYHENVDMAEIAKLEKMIPFVPIFTAGIAGTAFISTTLAFVLFLIYNLLPFLLSKSIKINYKE